LGNQISPRGATGFNSNLQKMNMMNFISKQKNTRGDKGEDKSSDSRYMMGPLDRDNQEY
jgi:hypothetical protein